MIPEALGEFICVEWVKPMEKTTASGIIVDAHKELRKGDMVKLQRGLVVNAGRNVGKEAPELAKLQVGDTVLYSEFDAQEFVHPDDISDHHVFHLVHWKYVKAKLPT